MLPFINYPFELLSKLLGASPDELKLIFSFLLSYPLAGVLKRIPDKKPNLKNAFIISIGLFYLVGLYSLWRGLWSIFLSSAVTYGLAYYMRTSPYMPWIAFVFLMSHMATNQLARQFANTPSVIDITGTQMVLVMKLSAFAWNVADGVLPEDILTAHQRDRRIVQLPSFIDYAAYILFFPCLMVGPACDYNEYKRWLDTTMFQLPPNVDPANRPVTKKKRKIPRSLAPSLWKLTAGLGWILLFLNMSAWYHPGVYNEERYVGYGLLRRIFTMYMVSFTARLKFYGVWNLSEGSCILAGLGYNGVDPVTGKVRWDRLRNINSWGVESAQNSHAYLDNWNMNTNRWLRYYVYMRVTPRNKKPGFRASMATFVTSAFWHGFYPGYYMAFVLASFVQTAAKNYRRLIRPLFLSPTSTDPKHPDPLPSKRYYDVASWFATQLIFTFVTQPFLILRADASWKVWSTVYFYGAVLTLGSVAVFSFPGVKKSLRGYQEERVRKATTGSLATNKRPTMVSRLSSTDSLAPGGGRRAEPVYGVGDVGKDIDEALQELKGEVDRREKEKENENNEGEKKEL